MPDNGAKHTPADRQLIDSISARQLMGFRDSMYTSRFIASNAARFLDHDWIDPEALREYLREFAPMNPLPALHPIRVKIKVPSIGVKAEPPSPTVNADTIKLRSVNEGGREIFELLSDSDSETESGDEVTEALVRGASRSSSVTPQGSLAAIDIDPSDDEPDSDTDLVTSDTLWADDFTSLVRVGRFRITRKLVVFRIEYIPDLASVYPVFREHTGIVVDLTHQKHRLIDPKTGKLFSLDSLVRNSDNDGWDWKNGNGKGCSTAWVTFVPGEAAIKCRRATAPCRGLFTDPASRTAVLAAQADTRRFEGTTAEQNVAIFMQVVINAKCTAVDSKSKACVGAPMMKAKPQGPSRGHQYWVACSGWRPDFKMGHKTHIIPDHVDEQLLANALTGRPIIADSSKDTAPCSKFVHAKTGLKQVFCPHPHIVDGVVVRCRIEQHECDVIRTMYIPEDTSIRKVLLVTNRKPHNHPMPTLERVSVSVKKVYEDCVNAAGFVGATVAKVDNASSTKVLLNGKTPSAFSAGLHSKRVKRDIIAGVKALNFPHGLDAAGVFHLYLNGLTKPLPERYIHAYVTTDDGGICILTFVPYLLMLLDDPGVIAFDSDTTYKRIEGKMNEWELTIFAKVVQRAATVVRAYINRASTAFFERLFDELQRVKILVTGKPIALKRFVPGGNLLVMNADMDGPQILGACRSAMKHDVPDYSGIPNDTAPEKVAREFVKICWRHGKEPVHDFKSLVSAADHARLSDFVYIDSKESLTEFSAFVSNLGIKKIQDWWAHKEMHPWIIPSLVKSQSPLSAEVWDTTPSTTNTNEAQHAWTNSLTGTGLSIGEALSAAHDVDQNVAAEIQLTLKTGIVSNPHNTTAHRVARNSTRQSTIARKARESDELAEEIGELEGQYNSELEMCRESSARSKGMKEKIPELKGKGPSTKSSRAPTLLSASSSGRVKSAPARTATAALHLSPQLANVPAQPVGVPAQPAESSKSDDLDLTQFNDPMFDFSMMTPLSASASNSFSFASAAAANIPIYTPAFHSPAYPAASMYAASDLSAPTSFAFPYDPASSMDTLLDNAQESGSFESRFDFDLDTLFAITPDYSAASGSESDFDWSSFLPTQDTLSVPSNVGVGDEWSFGSSALDWSALATSQALPYLPPPPTSSPLPANDDSPPSSPPVAAKKIDLELDPRNIVSSKRSRTASSRAAAASPVSKKPRSRQVSVDSALQFAQHVQ